MSTILDIVETVAEDVANIAVVAVPAPFEPLVALALKDLEAHAISDFTHLLESEVEDIGTAEIARMVVKGIDSLLDNASTVAFEQKVTVSSVHASNVTTAFVAVAASVLSYSPFQENVVTTKASGDEVALEKAREQRNLARDAVHASFRNLEKVLRGQAPEPVVFPAKS